MTPANRDRLADGSELLLPTSRRHAVVVRELGAGGQGAVYEVVVNGKAYALKWYHLHYLKHDTKLRSRIERAVARGAPSSKFLWPMELAVARDSASFGYLMPLRAPHFRTMRDLIAPLPIRISPSLIVRLNACCHVAESFLKLHAKGLSYQDINFGNLFLDPDSGDVCICDNDNVDVDGEKGSIFGTRKFMAPEIVRGEKYPDARTDLYSLAVLLFYVLHNWHPLDGAREASIPILDEDALHELYGANPRFIFDPADRSNGPVDELHDAVVLSWQSLSPDVRALFERTFVGSTRDAAAPRVVESEWRMALSRMRNSIIRCPECEHEQWYQLRRAANEEVPRCLACETPLKPLFVLNIGSDRLLLDKGRVFGVGAGLGRDSGDTGSDGARVEAHPEREDVLGLRNLGAVPWSVRLPSREPFQVPPGKTVRLLAELEIDFGPRAGTIIPVS